jgi:polyhydroxybutyrate depolymerase
MTKTKHITTSMGIVAILASAVLLSGFAQTPERPMSHSTTGGGQQRASQTGDMDVVLDRIFDRLDADGNETLSQTEMGRAPRLGPLFNPADADNSGQVTRAELRMALLQRLRAQRRGSGGANTGGATSTSELSPGQSTRMVTVGNRTRRYEIFVPSAQEGGAALPLVIAFHGGGANARSMINFSGLNETAENEGFIVAYPYGTGPGENEFLTWNGGSCCGPAQAQDVDDVAFTVALIDDIAAATRLDTGRVYATGMSNGGIMSYRVGNDLSGRIAAIAPVAASMGLPEANPARPVAVMHFHGTDDDLLPIEGGQGIRGESRGGPAFRSVEESLNDWIEANGCDPEPRVNTLPDAEDDGTQVIRKTWSGCLEDADVVLVEIVGGGHTWPGQPPVRDFLGASTRDISANEMMWSFFAAHARE